MKIRHLIYLLLVLFVAVSCKDEKEEIKTPARTVLVYMIAENNLSSYGYTNITRMIEGANAQTLNKGNLLVYLDSQKEAPQLIQIKPDAYGQTIQEVIKTYPEQNSASVEVMNSIFNEVLNDSRFEAENYGLMLWSHGTAWLPSNYKNMLRAFGQDGQNWMEIDDLVKAIPDHTFDFIIFDACYMASIEVVYALRNKAEHIIASPTEILGSGFPYQLIIEPMFRQTADLVAVCENFFNYYDQQSGLYRSATISLTKTAALEDLRIAAQQVLKDKEDYVLTMPKEGIQTMDLLSNRRFLFDLEDFIKQVASTSEMITFQDALDKVVVYKNTTPNATFNGGANYPINTFSGLSVYIPQERQVELNEWYRNLDWYKAVYK